MHSFIQFLAELRNPKEIASFRKDIKDIKGIDTRDRSWADNLSDYFKEHGFKLLGSGKYANVYGNDSYPFVLKVFMKDSAFFKWMLFCAQNKNNPYCPKFKGKVVTLSDNFFAIRVEKLTPVSYDEYQKLDDILSGRIPPKDEHLEKIMAYLNANKNILDMHSENAMMRGKQIVIVDPFYNWFDTKKMEYTIDPNGFSKDDIKNLI